LETAPESALDAGSGTIAPPAERGPFNAMPNTKQQKKRVRTAAQERLENLRYRSTAKTLAKRLEAAVQAGDKSRVETEHRELVRWLDRASARGALHRNTTARRKARAARLVAAGKR
jgi:small subunit ribosomal protein S20